MVLGPVHRGTSYHVLRLWYGGEFGRLWLGILRLFRGGVVAIGIRLFPRSFRDIGEGRGEDIDMRCGGLLPLALQRKSKGLGVGDSLLLEILEGFEVAFAFLALQLKQGDGGAQSYRIWVLGFIYRQ